MAAHDPLILLKQYLIETRLMSETLEEQMETEIGEELAEAVKQAESAPVADDPLPMSTPSRSRPRSRSQPSTVEPEGEEVNLVTPSTKPSMK